MFSRRLEVAGQVIDAISTGGVETCYRVPSFGVCLDIGRCPPGAERERTLLLTHAHIDHAAGLPYYVSLRGLIGAPPPTVYCPAHDRDALWHILESWSGLQADADRCELIGVQPPQTLELGGNACARAFRSPHRIATVGYTLYRRKKKLKAELQGLPKEEIASRARAGESVNEVIETPEICFPGDTTIEVVDREPSVTAARILLLECTFLGTKVDPERARRNGHVHLDDIAARADRFDNEVVVLTHFSRRYAHEEIEAEVKRALPASLYARVQLLLPT